jgi:hypothetical protein
MYSSAGFPYTRSNRPDPIVWFGGGGRSEVYFKFWVTCNLCSIWYPEKVGSFPYWLACVVAAVEGDPSSGLGKGSGHVMSLWLERRVDEGLEGKENRETGFRTRH